MEEPSRGVEEDETSLQDENLENKTVDEDMPKPEITSAWRTAVDGTTPNFEDGNYTKAIIVLVLLVILLAGYFLYSQLDRFSFEPPRHFSQVYSFVPEKISKSAAIPISLPEGIDPASAQTSITFDPQVKGEWVPSEQPSVLVFQPHEPLDVGTYYAATLETGDTSVRGDFLVDEDPEVIAVFPGAESEANEYSEITFMFNRPMVPLTTLDIQEDNVPPVFINPPTEGRFKWISTRNLQFIPKERLTRSSNYTVTFDDGFTSVEGLPVAGMTHSFQTRVLRYTGTVPGMGFELNYNRPAIVRFNQPVHLDRTKNLVTVTNTDTGEIIPAEVEYGIKEIYNSEKKKTESFIDRSALYIVPERDSHGRKRLWDFETNYTVELSGAVPLEGDITLRDPKTFRFNIPDVISSFGASSPRSDQVRLDLFDPEGKITISFIEEMNLSRARISAKGLKDIVYDQKCEEDEEGKVIRDGDGECKMVDDHKKFVLTFDPQAYGRSESFEVVVEKLVNSEGLSVLASPKSYTLTTYPKLVITKTKPETNAGAASVSDLVICSNTPLKPRNDDDFKQSLEASKRLVFGSWPSSWLVGRFSSNSFCQENEFRTTVRYGLLPENAYDLTLTVEDEFAQTDSRQLSFTTGKTENYYRFHSLQPEYNVTIPGRTKLTFATENLTYMNLRICKLSAENFLRVTYDQPEWYTASEGYTCDQVITDRIELPDRYWVNNYFQVTIQDYCPAQLGHYVLTFSHPDYVRVNRRDGVETRSQIHERAYLSVTGLSVAEKRVQWDPEDNWRKPPEGRSDELVKQHENLYWITNARSLNPIEGARVDLYTERPSSNYDTLVGGIATSYTSDENGIAAGTVAPDIVGAVVTSGLDSAIVSERTDKMQYTSRAGEYEKTYLYTDRPIYRPGHEVFIKGIDRVGFDGEYEILEGLEPTLTVYNSKGAQFYSQKLPMSAYGTFNTSVTIPADAPLGRYRIEAFDRNFYFDVEEYVPSPFDVKVTSEEEEYIAGDTMKVNIDANYFFGVPVEGGEVKYSVTAQNYYFDRYEGEYFNFGLPWYYCYSCGYGDSFLFRGKAELDENGHASIERKLDFDDLFKTEERDSSKVFVVNATIQDKSGRSVSSKTSFIVHRGEVYLGVKTDPRFSEPEKDVTVRAKSVDTQGEPIAVRSMELLVDKIEWKSFKRREVDGGFYWHSEKEITPVTKKRISTNRDGDGEEVIQFPEGGRYELTLKTTDARGNEISTKSTVYVYSRDHVSIRPTNNHDLELETDSLDVSVGDRPKVIVQSPYTNGKALITVERGHIFEHRVVDVTQNLFDFEVPIQDGYSPNVFVSVLLQSPDPEIKFGQLEFNVDRERRELDVEVVANKEQYLPGEQVTLEVTTKDYTGAGVPAEVSIAVADLSVLALKGNPKKNPLVFFYDGFPLTVTTASNLKNILHEVDIPLGTKGGGGGTPDDLAKRKRGVFKDTAFWEAEVVTDENGRARVTFTLPDNLTAWQIESIGITGDDTLVGADYAEFKARKDVMAVPIKPRFIIPGDEFSIGATVFNQTKETQTFTVSLSSETLTLGAVTEQKIKLGPEEQEIVYFPVTAPGKVTKGLHAFELSAVTPLHEDVVVQTIPVTPNETYESVATAHFTKDAQAREFVYIPETVLADKGGLTITANATLATFLSGALQYMVSYPYGCSEQLASKLSSIAIIKRGQSLEHMGEVVDLESITFEGATYTSDQVVTRALNRIYQSQNDDGGIAYYQGMKSSFYLTLHIIEMFHHLKEAGYDVNESSFDRAVQFVLSTITQKWEYSKNINNVIATTYILTEAGVTDSKLNTLRERVSKEVLGNPAFLNEGVSSLALGQLGVLTASDVFTDRERKNVMTQLTNRINIDGRGAYLKQHEQVRFWSYFETNIKNTALLLKAFAAQEHEHPLQDKILRWLLASRSKDGAWGSTNATMSVVDAMTDFLEWQRENESDFNLTITLDDEELFTDHFGGETVLDTRTIDLSINQFNRNVLQTIVFNKVNNNELNNNLYYDMLLKYYLPADQIPPRDEGITVERALYALTDAKQEEPLLEARVGDVIKGVITITVPKQLQTVAVEDIIPAGFEIVNFNLETEDESLLDQAVGSNVRDDLYALTPPETEPAPTGVSRAWIAFTTFLNGGDVDDDLVAQVGAFDEYAGYADEHRKPHKTLRADFEELHDDRVFLFTEQLRPGVYEYTYYIRALIPGTFQHLPAHVSEMYFPENFGRTEGNNVTISVED